MLTVHHLNNSRSQRVLWLLEELGLPYEIVRYQRQPDMRAPAELRAVHPLGKSPVVTDNGNTIAESGAIAEYIIETYGDGRLIPPRRAADLNRVTPGRWHFSIAFTPARPMRARWRRAGHIPWGGKSSHLSPTSGRGRKLSQAEELSPLLADGAEGKNHQFCTAAITSPTRRPRPRMSPVGSTESPRRTITICCEGRMTMRWP